VVKRGGGGAKLEVGLSGVRRRPAIKGGLGVRRINDGWQRGDSGWAGGRGEVVGGGHPNQSGT
jgi:hypothetical protein